MGRFHERLPTAHELSLKTCELSPWAAGLRGTFRLPAPMVLGTAGPCQEGQPQGAQGAGSSARRLPFAPLLHAVIRRTLRISCEAVPASDPAGAGMRRHVRPGNHAAESFVSCIRLLDCTFLKSPDAKKRLGPSAVLDGIVLQPGHKW
jgi:hypothetical protein